VAVVARAAIAAAIVMSGSVAHANGEDFFGKLSLGVAVDNTGVTGAALGLEAGLRGVRLGVELGAGDYTASDGSQNPGVSGRVLLKLSPIAFIRRLEFGRWFDAGVEVGIGLGSTPDTSYAEAWYGAWAEVAVARGDSYPLLFVEVRNSAVTDPFDNTTQYLFGVAWELRGDIGPMAFM
jgi:hypothetical protein